MSGLLDRAAAWFVTPLGSVPPATGPEPPLRVAREDELLDLTELGYADGRFAPPVAGHIDAPASPQAPRAEAAPRVGVAARVDVAPRVHAAPRAGVAPRAVILGAREDVPVAAAALALELRRRGRTGAAVVVLWGPGADAPPPPAAALAVPGLPSARHLAARLARRDIAASAHGRLVWVPLACDLDEEARVAAATGDAPVVLALLGPRSAAADGLLAAHDAALLAAEPDSALAALALADLGRLGVPLCCWAPPAGGAARLAALAGWRPPQGVPEVPA